MVREICRAFILTWRHWQCLHFDLKALAMPSFWAKIIANACHFDPKALPMPFFWPEGIANAFLFTLNGKFSLTIGMIMPLGQKKGIGNAFGSKWQAFTMFFAQKEGIANAFRSKWRHCQCLYLDICPRLLIIILKKWCFLKQKLKKHC